MEGVITINLAGNPYTMEISAHAALQAYLDRASAALAANPDKAEILRDLERSVAEKALAFLSPHKSVIEREDMDKILTELGPVDGEENPAAGGGETKDSPRAGTERRLYRVRDHYSWTGVSAGLAAYFGIDPWLVRVAWIVSLLFSGGAAAIAYILLMFVIPPASTPEQVAAARGMPFTAREVVDQAKRNFDEYAGDGAATRRYGRDLRRMWRTYRGPAPAQAAMAPSAPPSPLALLFGGVFTVVFSLISIALLGAFLYGLYALATSGAVLGWRPPADIPVWGALLLLCIVYSVAAGAVGALQNASLAVLAGAPRGSPLHRGGDAVGWIFTLIAVWALYQYVPEFRAFAHLAFDALRTALANLTETLKQ